MTLHSRLATALTAVAFAAVSFACASGGAAAGGSSSLSYGYMIPGPGVASAITGLRATDSLPELESRSTVPAVVTNAITQEVSSGNWNNGCTRRFGGPTVYTAIFHRSCSAAAGPEADPVVIVGFGADGKVIGRVRWNGPNTVTALVPVRRF